MKLYIDTTGDETFLRLDDGGKFLAEKKWPAGRNQSEELLQEVELLLAQNDLSKKNLTAIIVNPGPGKYTGQRVGVTTANFLGFALNLPVSSGKIQDSRFTIPVTPVYAHPPVITKSTK